MIINQKYQTLSLSSVRSIGIVAMFIVGNILFPQLCHFIPQGGLILLPIYFFTLIAAYKYGWQVGLLTALLSPIVNNLMFGMPPVAMLPAILVKGVILITVAAIVAKRFQKATIFSLLIVVLSYQCVGCLAEWAMKGNFFAAVQDFRIGIPGMVFQVLGGYLVLNYCFKK